MNVVFEREGGDKPVCVSEMLARFYAALSSAAPRRRPRRPGRARPGPGRAARRSLVGADPEHRSSRTNARGV